MKVTVTALARDWEALLRALPKCVECGQLAEVKLDGLTRCCNCAAGHRCGRCETLEHADALGAIEDALSPYVPAGKWNGSING